MIGAKLVGPLSCTLGVIWLYATNTSWNPRHTPCKQTTQVIMEAPTHALQTTVTWIQQGSVYVYTQVTCDTTGWKPRHTPCKQTALAYVWTKERCATLCLPHCACCLAVPCDQTTSVATSVPKCMFTHYLHVDNTHVKLDTASILCLRHYWFGLEHSRRTEYIYYFRASLSRKFI